MLRWPSSRDGEAHSQPAGPRSKSPLRVDTPRDKTIRSHTPGAFNCGRSSPQPGSFCHVINRPENGNGAAPRSFQTPAFSISALRLTRGGVTKETVGSREPGWFRQLADCQGRRVSCNLTAGFLSRALGIPGRNKPHSVQACMLGSLVVWGPTIGLSILEP